MKVKDLKWILSVAALVAGGAVSFGRDGQLKVGDPAPKLQTGKWVQGEPVKEFQKGTAYVVEFWATWCGPCRESIPHLNETYLKFKDKGLVVIGQDCWESDESKVAPFVKKMGDKMTYRVALDDKTDSEKGKMSDTWMAAAGRKGIPSAFLVDTEGLLAWIGHPMGLKDSTIEEVLAGKFDIKKAAVEYDNAQQAEAKMQTVGMELNRLMRDKDWDGALKKLSELEQSMPADQRGLLDGTRLNVLFGKEDYDSAYKLAAKMSESHKDEAMVQNQLAWQIATDKRIKQRDLELAETIANRANDAAHGKDAAILDTLARVKFMRGQKDEAIALEEKALKLAPSGEEAQYQQVLDSYKKGELATAQ